MQIEPIPIETFVAKRFGAPQIQALIDGWRVEPQIVQKMLVNHFRDMGLFFVHRTQDKLILRSMIHQLRTSPDIQSMVRRAETDELRKRKSRHAE